MGNETFLTQSQCQDSCLQEELSSRDMLPSLDIFYLKSIPSKLLCWCSVALGNRVIRNQDVCQWPLLILIYIMMVRPGAQDHQEDAVTEWLRERACEFMTDAVHSAVPAELLISSLLSCFPHFLIFSELTENYWQSIDNNYCEMCLLSDKRKTWNKYLTC